MTNASLTRRQAIATLASAATAPMLSACRRDPAAPVTGATSATAPADAEAAARALLDDIGNGLLQLLPESATSLGLDTGARAGLRAQLMDRSAEGQQRIAALLTRDLARAKAVDTAPLTHATRTSIDVVRSAYATALEGFAMPYGDVPVGGWRITPYVVVQNVGAYLDIPRMLDAEHRIENAADAEAYLSRLQSYAKQLAGERERAQAARAKGLVPPAFLLDKAIAQLRLAITGTREGGGLVESIARRTKTIPGAWADRARAIATKDIAPALEQQLAELEAQRAVATGDAGMWARPGGEAYYRWALKASTTTTMSPDEVHAMGRRELEQLHARMDAILRTVGYTQGTVGARMQALAKDPRYAFPEGDRGRAEILAFIDERLAWIRAQMPRAFGTVVNPNMEVKRLPPEEEPGAPAAYGGAGAVDGSIPGRFWINLRTTDLHSRYSLGDLTFHEAIPGHIWQGEYTHGMPLIRQMLAFNAYSEGWALYAEQLADELGAFENDPVGRLGYLQSIAFRACRLVVDTGLHAKRWTREQGVQFFVDVNGSNPLEVASEVDRYCSWPGQACGYKVGHTEINRQRDAAKTTLGDRFTDKGFNDTLLLGGNVPLDVLGRNVDAWVGATRA
ncbi:DUF885 domain-containing protein [Luteitalea sp.]|jgi:uncharacterized protein (DUF885 family)|uniref:DUF885 domain-containing protein n=1 Tax=Luteitalea sp. TaxID=2004800 RepID=UPI0037CA598A